MAGGHKPANIPLMAVAFAVSEDAGARAGLRRCWNVAVMGSAPQIAPDKLLASRSSLRCLPIVPDLQSVAMQQQRVLQRGMSPDVPCMIRNGASRIRNASHDLPLAASRRRAIRCAREPPAADGEDQ
jgi:hypothetical protein